MERSCADAGIDDIHADEKIFPFNSRVKSSVGDGEWYSRRDFVWVGDSIMHRGRVCKRDWLRSVQDEYWRNSLWTFKQRLRPNVA